jgi:hypothetical protein
MGLDLYQGITGDGGDGVSLNRQEVVMKRPLYFLFAYPEQARRAARELEQAGIGISHIHALGSDPSVLEGWPPAMLGQRSDAVGRIERVSWNLNLGIFLLALSLGRATGLPPMSRMSISASSRRPWPMMRSC